MTALLVAPHGDAEGAGAIAKTFNDLILSAAAIFFAFSFADARYWPTIGEAAAMSYFYTWGPAVVLSMIVDWTGTYIRSDAWQLVSLVLWFLSSALAIVSVVQILRLGNPARMNDYLAKNLIRGLRAGDATRFLRAAREAVVTGADLMARDLTDQLSQAIARQRPDERIIRVAADFTSEITWGAFTGTLSPLTAARSIDRVLAPEHILGHVLDAERDDASDAVVEAIHILVPLLSRFESQGRMLAEHAEFTVITDAALRAIQCYTTLIDPEPKSTEGPLERFTVRLALDQALRCFHAFATRPSPASAYAVYSLFQHVVGERYTGNFWDGAPILRDLAARVPGGFDTELRVVAARAILTSTLPSLKDSAGEGLGSERFVAVSNWTRLLLSLGPFGSAREAFDSWLSSFLRSHPVPSAPGDADLGEYEIAVGIAALHLLLLRPWTGPRAVVEAHRLLGMFDPTMRDRLRALIRDRTGAAGPEDYRELAKSMKEVSPS